MASTSAKVDPKTSLKDEISFLANCFLATGELQHLQKLRTVFEQAQRAVQGITLHKFADYNQKFNEGDPESMIIELQELGHNVEIDAAGILLLKKQLVGENLYVEYRLLKPFLAEASYQLRKEQDTHEELDSIAREALAMIKRFDCCELFPTSVPSEDPVSRVLPYLMIILGTILQSYDFDEKMLADCKNDTMKGPVHDIWERYAAHLDIDGARKLLESRGDDTMVTPSHDLCERLAAKLGMVGPINSFAEVARYFTATRRIVEWRRTEIVKIVRDFVMNLERGG